MSLTIYFLLLTIATAVAFPSNEIHLLMPHSGSAGLKHSDLDCLSWRLGVETNNIWDWTAVPQTCEDYVGHYMLGKQYRKDCDLVAEEAYEYAKGLDIIWVFDIDETTLSNLPYYARDTVAFGAIPYNSREAKAPPIPGPLKLYKRLVRLGLKIVFLTGSHDYQTDKRKELEEAEYKIRGNMGDQWSDLLGRNPAQWQN